MDNDDDQDDDDDIWIIESFVFPAKKKSIENGWSVSEDFVSLSFASVFFLISKKWKHSIFLFWSFFLSFWTPSTFFKKKNKIYLKNKIFLHALYTPNTQHQIIITNMHLFVLLIRTR